MRRGWREGSICRRTVTRKGKEYHYWRAILPGAPRREFQARTEREARAWLRANINRPRANGVTLGDYAVDWLHETEQSVKPTTAAFYRYSLRHLAPIADVPLQELTPQHVRGLITTTPGSSRTVRGVVQTLRQVLGRAMHDELIERNVATLVRLPKQETREPRHFTAAEARRFLEVAKDDELGALYTVALGTGLRRGELLGLTWRDVDRGTIRVAKAKTAAGIRLVPLPPFAADALHRLDRRPGHIWPVDPTYVSKHFQVLCKEAGVPVITLHGLRHTAASLMLDAGVPIEVIRSILGHTKVSMSAHYARPGDELRRDAVEKLGRAVG